MMDVKLCYMQMTKICTTLRSVDDCIVLKYNLNKLLKWSECWGMNCNIKNVKL